MTRRYLFIGPTVADVRPHPEIDLLPPVAAGDLLALDASEGDVVGIVDGYFHQDRAIRHKEILAVMARGVHVLGAASMGALRAAELDRYGMRGVGAVYRDYRSSRIDADDEVALMHGPAEDGYRAMSEPLVNIRATLAEAVRHGACRQETADRVVAALREMPYPRRLYQRFGDLAERTGQPHAELVALGDHCARHRVDVKRRDALQLIDSMTGALRPPPHPDVNRTLFLHMWALNARGRAESTGDVDALRALQLFAADYPRVHRRVVLGWLAEQCAAECFAQCDEAYPGDEVTRAVEHGVHAGIYRLDGDTAFLDGWLTPDERRLCAVDRIALFLVRSFELVPGIRGDELLLERLRDHTGFARAVAAARAAARLHDEALRHEPRFDPSLLSAERIARLLLERWRATPDEAELRALERGLGSFEKAVAAARLFYLLARREPATLRLSVEAEALAGDLAVGAGLDRTGNAWQHDQPSRSA
jgi:hypothetical protein